MFFLEFMFFLDEKRDPGNSVALKNYLDVRPIQIPKRLFSPIQSVNIPLEFYKELATVLKDNRIWLYTRYPIVARAWPLG